MAGGPFLFLLSYVLFFKGKENLGTSISGRGKGKPPAYLMLRLGKLRGLAEKGTMISCVELAQWETIYW